MTKPTVTARPAFRKPWEHGAKGYVEADTFAAALEGFKRVRKDKLFHMPNTGEAGKQVCVVCKNRLDDFPNNDNGTIHYSGATPKVDKWSTWTYSAKRKQVGNGMHYVCSWSALFSQLFKAADAGLIG